ncbi:MAG: GNAT family N-acetyltransferase [Chloroflexi bacterium]|nr:GNAT family N-acetyltransferase [Chloroflexota bacterium]
MSLVGDAGSSSAPAIRALEELSLNAWPALQTVLCDGWLLRFAAGYTRRANSVQPLYPGTDGLVARVAHCEAAYGKRRLPTVFKLTPAAEPAGLDALLAARGYRLEAPTSVQALTLSGATTEAPDPAVTLQLAATDAWLDDFCRLNGIAARHRLTMGQMLTSLTPAACFLSLPEAGTTVALGLAVLERGHVGLFDIVVAPERRGQGLGRRVVATLLAWGRAGGAHTAYLQVMRDNTTALRLYAGLGFREHHGYWYRVLDGA